VSAHTTSYNVFAYTYILSFVSPESVYKIIYFVVRLTDNGRDATSYARFSNSATNTFTEFTSTPLLSHSITWCNVVDTRVNTRPVLTKNTEFQTRLYIIIFLSWCYIDFGRRFLVRSCVMLSGAEQDVDRNGSKGVFLFSVARKKGRGLTSRGWYYILYFIVQRFSNCGSLVRCRRL